MCDMVVDGNELDDTGRLRVLREIEDESKFVPSQFNRETQGQWGERRYNDGHDHGYRMAVYDAATMMSNRARVAPDQVRIELFELIARILELKP